MEFVAMGTDKLVHGWFGRLPGGENAPAQKDKNSHKQHNQY
jgi:hypothetical protein